GGGDRSVAGRAAPHCGRQMCGLLRHPAGVASADRNRAHGRGRSRAGWEFSFIFIALAVGLQVIPELGRDLLVAGAFASILLVHPLVLPLGDRLRARLVPPSPTPEPERLARTSLAGHVVLVGYGRVGGLIGEAARARGEKLLVIEYAEPILERLRGEGIEVLP